MDGTLQSMQNGLDAFCRQRADERPVLQDALEVCTAFRRN